MNLIEVKNENGKQLVSARDLHGFLEVRTRYNDWIKSRIEKYDFVENADYSTLTENLVSGGSQNIHIITISMAKELAMVENNDRGKEARRYFIECEKKLQEVKVDSYMISNPRERALAWAAEEEERERLAVELLSTKEVLIETKEELEIKSELAIVMEGIMSRAANVGITTTELTSCLLFEDETKPSTRTIHKYLRKINVLGELNYKGQKRYYLTDEYHGLGLTTGELQGQRDYDVLKWTVDGVLFVKDMWETQIKAYLESF